MVSFQCHTCGDVVKKPKLDQHYGRCHGGFDCIDCSTTFNSPAEYKGHVSCISEAEKYQKSLYKGPKTNSNGYGHHGNGSFRGHGSGIQRGRGGRGGGGWNQPRNQSTGANLTPLGSPNRMSPVTPADEIPSPHSSAAPSAPVVESQSAKDKESKKRKRSNEAERPVPSTSLQQSISKMVTAVEQKTVTEPASVPSSSPRGKDTVTTKGKDKKKKEKQKLTDETSTTPTADTIVPEVREADADETKRSKEKGKKEKKEKKKRNVESESAEPSNSGNVGAGDGSGPVEGLEGQKREKRKEKKEKKKDEESKKSKKRKRDGDEENGGNGESVENVTEKQKKQKKADLASANGGDANLAVLADTNVDGAKEKKRTKEKKNRDKKIAVEVAA